MLFYQGSTDFTYAQFPFPFFSGDFHVEGGVDTTNWEPLNDEGVGGFIAPDSTGNESLLYFAVESLPDTSFNLFGLYYAAEGPIVEGTVANPLLQVQVFFIYELDSLIIPDELPDSLTFEDILGAIVAEHILVGGATSMEVLERTEEDLSLSFAATLIDLEDIAFIVNLSEGASTLHGFEWTEVADTVHRPQAARLDVAPNPFNPATNVQIVLPAPATVRLRVYDLLGRRRFDRALGTLGAGGHRLPLHAGEWPGGVYIVSVESERGILASERILLLK